MVLPRAEEREPWPKPRRPIPVWPLVGGPLIGLGLAHVPPIAAIFPQSAIIEFGFAVGVFLGLLTDFAILLARRQYFLQTWLVGGAAAIVLIGLARALFV
jgi:hypothetical protein